MDDVADEVALAVDDDHRTLALLQGDQIPEDQVLEELGLAVAGAADDVGVLEACLEGDREGQGGRQERRERRAGEIAADERLGSFGLGLARPDQLPAAFLGALRVDAGGSIEVAGELGAQLLEMTRGRELIGEHDREEAVDGAGGIAQQGMERHGEAEPWFLVLAPGQASDGQLLEQRDEHGRHRHLETAHPSRLVIERKLAAEQSLHLPDLGHVEPAEVELGDGKGPLLGEEREGKLEHRLAERRRCLSRHRLGHHPPADALREVEQAIIGLAGVRSETLVEAAKLVPVAALLEAAPRRSSGRMVLVDRLGERRTPTLELDGDDLLAAPGLHRLEEAAEEPRHAGDRVLALDQGQHAPAGEEAAGEDVGDADLLADLLIDAVGAAGKTEDQPEHGPTEAPYARSDQGEKNRRDGGVFGTAGEVAMPIALRENGLVRLVAFDELGLLVGQLEASPELEDRPAEQALSLLPLEEQLHGATPSPCGRAPAVRPWRRGEAPYRTNG